MQCSIAGCAVKSRSQEFFEQWPMSIVFGRVKWCAIGLRFKGVLISLNVFKAAARCSTGQHVSLIVQRSRVLFQAALDFLCGICMFTQCLRGCSPGTIIQAAYLWAVGRVMNFDNTILSDTCGRHRWVCSQCAVLQKVQQSAERHGQSRFQGARLVQQMFEQLPSEQVILQAVQQQEPGESFGWKENLRRRGQLCVAGEQKRFLVCVPVHYVIRYSLKLTCVLAGARC